MIYALKNKHPKIADSCFIAPGAQVIGQVELGEQVSVWFNAVLRGDAESIKVGSRTNIQDGCILHEDAGFPLIIGEDVTIGHRAIVHGCIIGNGVLIGMGATVLNGAVIGEGALVGAGAVVPPGKVVPPHTMVLGAPAKVVREFTDEDVRNFQSMVDFYNNLRAEYKEGLKPVE